MALTGKELANFAKSKEGTPYVYGAKGAEGVLTQTKVNALAKAYPNIFTTTYLNKIKNKLLVGKICCDCSGLISWYTKKVLGSAQLYSTAYARLPISEWKKFAVGTVLWKSGHCGVYLGDGLVAEEKGIDYGCIISKIEDTKWVYGLTFTYMNYSIDERVDSDLITYKGENPYAEPEINVKVGIKDPEAVKWVQWELNEAGYNLTIDGEVGSATVSAIKAFQKSCKIVADGIAGATTRYYLKADNVKAADKVVKSTTTTTAKATSTTTVKTTAKKEENPYTKPRAVLKKGSKGVTIKWVQWELNEAGFNAGDIDGYFGAKTEAAVKAYQKKYKLAVDGIVGPATRDHLANN